MWLTRICRYRFVRCLIISEQCGHDNVSALELASCRRTTCACRADWLWNDAKHSGQVTFCSDEEGCSGKCEVWFAVEPGKGGRPWGRLPLCNRLESFRTALLARRSALPPALLDAPVSHKSEIPGRNCRNTPRPAEAVPEPTRSDRPGIELLLSIFWTSVLEYNDYSDDTRWEDARNWDGRLKLEVDQRILSVWTILKKCCNQRFLYRSRTTFVRQELFRRV